MTDRQIQDIDNHPRDPLTGALVGVESDQVWRAPDRELTLEEERSVFFGFGRAVGCPEEELEAAWKAKQESKHGRTG